MFERLQEFLKTLKVSPDRTSFDADDPRLAVAALCIQVMEADGVVRESEQEQLRHILAEQYDLEGGELQALIDAGREAGNEAVDYYRFTSELKRHLDEEQRRNLIGLLWDMVYADGERSEMEDHALWRIADLLGVSGRDRVEERQKAALRAEHVSPDEIKPL
ncbi:tellurite resistance TerB family protein [Gellertiella hungarica]|uniref:Putative tellurite resistance protein B-like protein n=1 Tax=Gellertiella hungarica TaxID=1572859 RepID=A0A7W6J7D5_9HYPH|nr:TerB family tellurite resistance protein [Gellertiella hungarica]MBB4065241.1 putative tellurite resistance protein B-like protein [Gellertiella hungarica]